MADENIKFKIDLDAKEAIANTYKLKDEMGKLANSDMRGLLGSIGSLNPYLLAIGATLAVLKGAFDLTKEAEQIDRINKNFDSLADSVGVSSQAMKDGIDNATKGLVDNTDAMEAANKAMIRLGANSARIPDIMDLARRSGKAFGVETLDAFDMLSTSIANGNAKMLKQLGITIDADKAQRDYAKSIGVAVSTLSEEGKQQALLNAVLAKGNEKFKESADGQETLGNTMKQASLAFKDLYEALAIWVSKSEVVKGAVAAIGRAFSSTAKVIKDHFGSELDQTSGKLEKLTKEYTALEHELSVRKNMGTGFFEKMFGDTDEEIKAKLDVVRKNMADLVEKQQKLTPKEEKKDAPKVVATNDDKALIQRGKFEADLLKLQEARVNAQLENETSYSQSIEMLQAQIAITAEQYESRKAEIKAQALRGDITYKQAAILEEEIEREKTEVIKKMQDEVADNAMKAYDRQLKAAKSLGEGIAAGFAQGGAQAKKDFNDMGKQGQIAFNAVNSGAQRFFKGLGEGSKDGAELMKEFMFGSIADIAEAEGKMLLASGIGSGNGIAIAEGGALLALSGLLRAQSGGGASSSGGGGSSSGGGAYSGGSDNNNLNAAPQLQEEKKKSVTIQVQGNYFETEQTNTRLLEMIRSASDATDFKYQQIGVR